METGPEIDLHSTALIPDDYLPDVHARLVLYKRIANAINPEELWELKVEMIDRFGLLPDPTKNLFAITEIKLLANKLGIRKIEVGPSNGRILFTSQPKINPEKIIELVQKQPDRYKLDGPDKLQFAGNFEALDKKADFVDQLLESLQEHT